MTRSSSSIDLAVLVRRLFYLALLEAGFDALDCATHLVDALDVLPRQALDLSVSVSTK